MHIESVASTITVISLLVMMTLSPFFVHLHALRGPANRIRILAYIGYIWMSLLLIFCLTAISIDIYNYAAGVSGSLFQKDLSGIIFSPVLSFFIPVIFSVVLNIYGYFEAGGLHIERLTVETSKLPEGVDKLTIAHISDLHLGIILREKKLDKVLEGIESAEPDLIVSTGDLLDDDLANIGHLSDMLKRVNARLGKFAVTGNHEFYAGIKQADKFLQDSGFTVLRGEGTTVQNLINIAGVDDPTVKYVKQPGSNSSHPEREILSKLPQNGFTLLLKHRPSIDDNSLGLFDLQLSGHVHKGQFLPIRFITKLIYHTDSGFSRLPGGSAIYVSPGAGTAGPPVRLFARPEIAIIEVVAAKA